MRFFLRESAAGFSFVELLIASALILVLASAAVPLTQVTIQRQKEIELKRSLRILRSAIDSYKDAVDLGEIDNDVEDGDETGYPPDLEILVTGVETLSEGSGARRKFLRRIPVDPFTGDWNWGLRSYEDSATASRWGGGNVYDVYSTNRGRALNGTRYRDW
tara:strand:- start:19533 stop:20015 length:483 start_codon:yes stop_codon:yes gene_type:complete